MLGYSERNSGTVVRENFVELVGQSVVRFRKELRRYFFGFVWGTLFGVFIVSWKPQTVQEKLYEQANTRANRILDGYREQASRGNTEVQTNGIWND